MISRTEITIISDNKKQSAELICNDENISITLKQKQQKEKTYKGSDFYKCFGKLRSDNKHIQFLCKGSKINVHPSSMSSQMSLGLNAYELSLGKEPSLDNLVFIFDYEDKDLTNEPIVQREFYYKWLTNEQP
ncbi:hypothetical protein [Pseudomonas sp. B35(2017)]|uniref:hypothetical protein n=1 Tax=Pseudomonas sp. B35(2017) TaxID=1981722 RepID=UPI000A1E1584|nr:hypothetical protein [Pseudomonas sp. B35(2017)]